jgi:hypothetical protein
MEKKIKRNAQLPRKLVLSRELSSACMGTKVMQFFIVSSTFALASVPNHANASNLDRHKNIQSKDAALNEVNAGLDDKSEILVLAHPINTSAVTVQSSLVLDQLDQIGRVWISEAPSLLTPKLSLTAPTRVVFKNNKISDGINFNLFCNYSAFIKKAEILIYSANDTDRVKPIIVLPIEIKTLNNQQTISWNGQIPASVILQLGQQLSYSLRVYDALGRWDETFAKKIKLVNEEQNFELLNQLKNNTDLTSQIKSQEAGLSLDEFVIAESNWGNDNLVIQNIPLIGSSVKLRGQDIEPGYDIKVNQQIISIDSSRQFTTEYLLPVGQYEFEVEAASKDKKISQTLKTKISGEHFFMVGIADLTYSKNSYSGALEAVNADDYKRFTGNHTDGRLAFYLKAKIKGQYLLTAQADTQEKDLKELTKNFLKADRTDVFRRIDPELYYPIYGDDSTPIKDIDTSGRLYIRLDWDKSYVNWGNVRTEFDSNKLASFNRSLYGSKIAYRSVATTQLGEPQTQVKTIAAQQQTAPGRSEFLGTGGSLYYLRHTDIVPQSEKIILQIRESGTGRVRSNYDLKAGRDYEMDAFQGRIILSRPLRQISKDNSPLDDFASAGLENILLVQYEYYPADFDTENYTAGVNAKQWLGEHVALGASYVKENRTGQDFQLSGLDLTLQAGAGTWLKVEGAQSKSTLAERFFSTDGGLKFNEIKALGAPGMLGTDTSKGEAFSIEARFNSQELNWTENPWKSAFWIKQRSPQFSSENTSGLGKQTVDKGFELVGQINSDLQLVVSHKNLETSTEQLLDAESAANDNLPVKTAIETLSSTKAAVVWQISNSLVFQSQLQHVKEEKTDLLPSEAGLLGFQLTKNINPQLEVFILTQNSFAQQNYANNNAAGVGVKYLFNKGSSVSVDYTQGDRGSALTAATDIKITPAYSVFGSYSYSPKTSENSMADYLISSRSFTEQTSWAIGQRFLLNEKTKAVTETKLQEEFNTNSLMHHLGLEYTPFTSWNFGLSLQKGQLTNRQNDEAIQRQAASLSATFNNQKIEWSSKLECRIDSSSAQSLAKTEQWLSTNRLAYKVSDDWRLIAKLNYSTTVQNTSENNLGINDSNNPASVSSVNTLGSTQAKLLDVNLGFAWRPITGRWSVLAKYGYLYDLAPLGQISNNGSAFDQESHIFAIEANYELNRDVELAGKLAQRQTLTRLERGQGPWFSNNATYGAAQVRLKLRALTDLQLSSNKTTIDFSSHQASDNLWKGWAVLSEYRALKTEQDGVKKGALVSIEKDINKYQKISVGYNFTDFSSDISQLSYKSKGFFINFIGRF